MKRYILVYIGLFFCVSCNRNIVAINTLQSNKDRKIDTLALYLEEWNKDSLGCLYLRNHTKAEYLINKLSLKTKKINDIIILLGKPNSTIENSNRINISYYFGMSCDSTDGKIIINTDACWVGFSKDIRFNENMISISCN